LEQYKIIGEENEYSEQETELYGKLIKLYAEQRGII
jgi:hypothetical protein